MKKFLIPVLLVLLFACNSINPEVKELQELAKKHTTENLKLPRGTPFDDDSFIIKKYMDSENDNEGLYAVTLTFHSQDKKGEGGEQTHVLLYKKIHPENDKPNYELISFE